MFALAAAQQIRYGNGTEKWGWGNYEEANAV